MNTEPHRCEVHDLFSLTSRTKTPEGFLVAPATLARTGIQEYRADELGLEQSHGMDADRIVRLFRPREEVFSPASMATFERKPMTMDHPPPATDGRGAVNAENWRAYAVGDVHSVGPNGDHLAAQIVVRDAAAIEAIESGKSMLSNGYTFDLDLTAGTAAGGNAYDGIQRNIRGNHVAIVDKARGGSACRIADSHVEADAIDGDGQEIETFDGQASYEANLRDPSFGKKRKAEERRQEIETFDGQASYEDNLRNPNFGKNTKADIERIETLDGEEAYEVNLRKPTFGATAADNGAAHDKIETFEGAL